MAVNQVIVGDEVKLDLTADTVSENNLLAGATAHNAAGEPITGAVVTVPVDSELSETSENAIQNRAVAKAIKGGNSLSGTTSYTITDSVEYPLVGLKVYGKSTQDGTPTAENPVEITSVENPTVTVCGKNLFPWNDYTKLPCYFWSSDWSIKGTKEVNEIQYVLTDTTTAKGGLIVDESNFKPLVSPYNGQYMTLSWEMKVDDDSTLDGYMACGLQANWVRVDPTTQWARYSTTSKIDISKTNYRLTWYGKSNSRTTVYIRNIQIEIGDTVTEYEPYKANTLTFSDTLNAIPVSSGGNVTIDEQEYIADYKDYGTGKYHRLVDPDKLDPTVSIVDNLDLLLASEEITDISEAEMLLYRQLQTYNGTTNISNDKGAGLSVKYCTNKALSACAAPITTGLQKQIDELKAAVLSLGGNV